MAKYAQPLMAAVLLGAGLAFFLWKPWENGQAQDKPPKRDKFGENRGGSDTIPFDAERAHKYLKQLCDLGPRVSATDGMAKQIDLLTKHFEAHGATVERQEFEAKQYSRRDKVKMTNLIASWHPERKRRVMLCSHYDTRPIAHEERNQNEWRKPFLSANDGTSGVAMFMELAHHAKDLSAAVGVDFVCFDGEEYIFEKDGFGGQPADRFFFGSDHFAEKYVATIATRKFQYEAAVLYDLFAHRGAKFEVEGNSWEKSDKLASQFWKVALDRRAKSFVNAIGRPIQDDHLALHRAGIPAIDIIDLDGYEKHWHKLSDTPDKVDPQQMAEVAGVTAAWLQGLK
jgi:glutaminyl-peptide cyclotransferase